MLTETQVRCMRNNMQEAMSFLQRFANGGAITDKAAKMAALCNNRLARIVRWKGFMDGVPIQIVAAVMQSFPEHEEEIQLLKKDIFRMLTEGHDTTEIVKRLHLVPVSLVPTHTLNMLPASDIGGVVELQNDLENIADRAQVETNELLEYVVLDPTVCEAVAYELHVRFTREERKAAEEEMADYNDDDFPEAPPHEQHPAP